MNELNLTSFIVALLQIIFMTILFSILVYNRFNDSRIYFKALIFICLSSCTIALIMNNSSSFRYYEIYVIYLIILIISLCIYKIKIINGFINLFSILSIFYFLQTFQILFFRFLYSDFVMYKRSIRGFVYILSINSFLLIFTILVIVNSNMRKLFVNYVKLLKDSPMFILNIGIVIILVQKFVNYENYYVWENYYWIFFLTMMLFYFNYLGLKKNMELMRERSENEFNSKFNILASRMLEDSRRKQHEFDNHLNTIYSMICFSEDIETTKEYIRELTQRNREKDFLLEIENRVIAATLYSYIDIMLVSKIDFTYKLEKDLNIVNISNLELVELLSNLLNNSIEYLDNVNLDEKHIELEIAMLDDIVKIVVANNIDEEASTNLSRIIEKGESTKGENRGFGLKNVNRIIEDLNGEIKIIIEDNIFRVEILF